MRDRRESLKKGTCINVGGGEYIVDECISSGGGQALIYRCHLKEHESAQRYVLKEYYPPEAVRENGAIVEGPGWKFRKRHSLEYYYQKAKKAEAYAALFRQKSHQAQFVSEVIPDEHSMVSLMRMASDDCKTIKQKLEEWYSSNLLGLAQHSDLYRVQESVKIIKGVLVALDMLHGKSCGNIVHRDLTPGNILIAESRIGVNTEYTIYPIDFSCAAPIGSPFDKEMSVSPGYTHPVLHENSHLLDLYSVAALLLVLVTGKECLHRVDNWEVNNLIVENNFYIDEALTTLDIPLGIRSKLGSVLKRAVSMNAVDRYSSAKEMYTELETLQEIIDGRGIHPEVLFDASAKEFKEQCENKTGLFCYEIKPDLVTEAIDYESEQPKNLLEQNTVLLGGGGAGKTTKIRTLWENCLDNWIADQENNPIPVFVPLSTFDSSEDGKNYIKDYIAKRYFPNLSETDSARRAALMGMLRSQERYILLLDGINESAGNDKLNAEVAEFATIERVTVLITSRNELGDGWDETKKLFSTAELLPLNDDLIIRKLHDKELDSPSQRLLTTLRRPMFLSLYLNMKLKDADIQTTGQILYAHHKHLKDGYKTGHHGDWEQVFDLVMEKVLPDFAITVGRMAFDRQDVGAYTERNQEDHRFKDAAVFLEKEGKTLDKYILEVLDNCGLIRKQDESYFVFRHQFFLEFYQGYAFARSLQKEVSADSIPTGFFARLLDSSVITLVEEIWKDIQNTGKPKKRLTDTVLDWLEEGLAKKRGNDTQIAVCNLVEILKQANNGQLQDLHFDYLDLSKTDFSGCNLQNTTFTGAVVPNSAFFFSRHRCRIDSAKIADKRKRVITWASEENKIVVWNMYTDRPVFEITEQQKILRYDISPDERWLAVCCRVWASGMNTEYRAEIYDLDTGNKEKEFKLDRLVPNNLFAFSDDSKCLICGSDKRVLLYKLLDKDDAPSIVLFDGTLIVEAAISPNRQCLIISSVFAETPDGETWRNQLYHINLNTAGTIASEDTAKSRVWKIDSPIRGKMENLLFPEIIFSRKGHYAIITNNLNEDEGRKTSLIKLDLGSRKASVEKTNGNTTEVIKNYFASKRDEESWNSERILEHLQINNDFHTSEKDVVEWYSYSDVFASEKGTFLACIDSFDGRIRIFNSADRREVCAIHARVRASESFQVSAMVTFSGNNTVIRADSIGNTEYIDIQRKTYKRLCETPDDVYTFNPLMPQMWCENGKYQMTQNRSSEEVTIWDLCRKEKVGNFMRFDSKMEEKAYFFPTEYKVVTTTNISKIGYAIIRNVHIENSNFGDSSDSYQTSIGRVCEVIDTTIVIGTENGHVQFWNLDGVCQADFDAHNGAVVQIIPVLKCTCFLTIAEDQTAKIWNTENMQCWPVEINTANMRYGTRVITETKMDQGIHGILGAKEIIVGNRTFYWWHFHDARNNNLNYSYDDAGGRVAIWSKKLALIQVCKIDGEPLLYLNHSHIGDTVQSFSLSPDGKKLAIARSADQIVIYSVPEKLAQQNIPELVWEATTAATLRDCSFWCAKFCGNDNMKTLLKMNGALTD